MAYGALPSSASTLAADGRSLNSLKLQAGQSTPEAIKETAKQFESLFMRELLKSMREATMKSGMMDSPGSDLGTDLLDQQFAVQMSGQPGGLSDMIAQQLTRQMGGATLDASALQSSPKFAPLGARTQAASAAAYAATANTTATTASAKQTEFVQRHNAAAQRIEQTSGLPSGFMLGQAGHETGWGKHEIKMANGAPSHNLFGIKAGSSWTGKVAQVTTTEYVDGVARKTVAKFRAYDSYEDSFKDYARLITRSPRYAQVSQQTNSAHAFATELQKAGYATDPNYANKLGRAINSTLRLQQQLAQSTENLA